jgi:hypothetical protein
MDLEVRRRGSKAGSGTGRGAKRMRREFSGNDEDLGCLFGRLSSSFEEEEEEAESTEGRAYGEEGRERGN